MVLDSYQVLKCEQGLPGAHGDVFSHNSDVVPAGTGNARESKQRMVRQNDSREMDIDRPRQS